MEMIEIELPDGTILEVPKDTPQDQIMSAVQRLQASPDTMAPAQQPIEQQVVSGFVPSSQQDPMIPSGDTDTRSTAEFVQDQPPPPFVPFQTDTAYRDPEGERKTFRDALGEYQGLVNDPNTKRLFGIGPRYQEDPETGQRRFIVPPNPLMRDLINPFRSSEETRAGITAYDKSGRGFMSMLGNIGELAGVGVDSAASLFGANTRIGPAIREATPRLDSGDSVGDALLIEGVPIAASAFAGGAGVYNALSSAPKLLRGLVTYLSSEAAATAATTTESSGLLIGEDAMLTSGLQDKPLFSLLRGIDPESSEANDIIESRVNLLLDGLITGGVVGGTVVGAARGTKLIYDLTLSPLVNIGRPDRAIQDRAVTEIFSKVERLVPGMSATEQSNLRKEIVRAVEENREVILPLLNDLDESVTVTMDTLGALLRGVDTPESAGLYSVIQGIRRGFDNNQYPLTQDRIRQPQQELDVQTDEMLRGVGGDTPAEQTSRMADSADAFAQQGRDSVTGARQVAEDAEVAYRDAADNFLARVGDDLEITEEVERLFNARGTEVTIPRDASREQIEAQVRASYETMKAAKNQRYAAIEGGPIDTGALYDALSNVKLDELSRQATTLQRTSPLKEIAELFQPQFRDPQGNVVSRELVPFDPNTPGTIPAGYNQESRNEVIKRMNGWFARDPEMYNFGYFHTIIRPELSDLATGLYGKSDLLAGNAVRDVVRAIDGPMVDFVANTDPRLADAAVEAKRYYSEEFAPFWRDNKLENYSLLYDGTIGRSSAGGPEIRASSFESGSETLIESTIRGGNTKDIDQFRRILETPEAGADSSALADYMVFDAIGNMATSIRSSDLVEVPIGTFTDALKQYSGALRNSFPEKADELNQFIRRVESVQGDVTQLRTLMDEAQTQVTQTKELIQSSELSNFFSTFSDTRISDPILRELATTSDPFSAFSRIFSDNRNSIDITNALMERIRTAPDGQREILEAGMQTAYSKHLREKILAQVPQTGDVLPTRVSPIERGLVETTTLFRVGDEIFSDKPEVMSAIRGWSAFASDATKARNATAIPGQSPTQFNQEAARAASRIVYATMGPLTRAGTRIRALVNAVVESADLTNLSVQVMDNILSDPDLFVTIARRLAEKPSDPNMQELFVSSIFRGYIRSSDGSVSDIADSTIQGAADLETQMFDLLPQ